MKFYTKLFLLSVLFLLGLGFININPYLTNAQPAGGNASSSNTAECDGFGANFAACGVSDIGVIGTSDADTTKDSLITVIKKFINRILGILSLITLILLLRGGFQMVTAAGDDGKFKAGFKILKQAAMGLAFIGLSRLMVSLIFWIISTVTTGVA